MKFIILSNNPKLIEGINRYLTYGYSIVDVNHFTIKNPERDAYENFLVIKDWIEGLFKDNISEMKQIVAFLDLPIYDFYDFMPTSEKFHGLASLLYLTFPEVHWVFMLPITSPKSKCFEKPTFERFHTIIDEKELNLEKIIQTSLYGYTPLFDPTGARSQIIHQTLQHMKNTGEDILSERPFSFKRDKKALAMDEELAYSYLHAYVAYKMGYRSMLVSTKQILDVVNKIRKDIKKKIDDLQEDYKIKIDEINKLQEDNKIKIDEINKLQEDYKKKIDEKNKLLEDNKKKIDELQEENKKKIDERNKLQENYKKNNFDISFEDICLSFPDKNITNDLSKREKENVKTTEDDKLYSFFQKIPKRIFITIGESKKLKKKNKEYRKKLKAEGKLRFYKILYKPYAGIFNLIKSAKLKFRKIKLKNQNSENITGHSAPGRFGLIAGFLIERCKKILVEADSPVDAIYAAVLALQAQEILGGRTATLSIEAISLKHQAEVKAECMFYGVEHNFDVKSRFKEISRELHVIGQWFNKSSRELMIYNSELNIINELARIFKEYSQFDEEQSCLEKVRTLSRKIYRKRNKLLGWLVSPFRWYFEFLVSSLARFIAAIVFWPLLFTFIYYFSFPPGTEDTFVNAFSYSINAFFGAQFTITDCPFLSFLSIIPILLGFFHLGIFISHLYTIVSRR